MDTCRVLVSLDCIFDTVYGTVVRMGEHLLDGVLSNGYWARNHNQLHHLFPKINQDEFNKLYSERNVDTLKVSLRTEYLNVLQSYTILAKSPDKENPDNVEYTFTINTYPYKLTDNELVELFTVLKEILNTERVYHINAPANKLTVKYLNDNYDRFVLYNFIEWDMFHRKEIVALQKRLPLTIYFPLIFKSEMALTGNVMESTTMTKFAFSPAFTLEIMELGLVSVMIPKNTNKETSNQGETNGEK